MVFIQIDKPGTTRSSKNNSHTGNRTRAYRVKAGDPNH
jgi:hypothetical protein